MARPFDGIRVLDLTHVIAGPFATHQLAMLGADVIKIEAPDRPDPARHRGVDPVRNAALRGLTFQVQGSGKRAITLDLSHAAGRETLLRLARRADVLVENYRTGALDELGLGPEVLDAANPRLIQCSLTGFGATGARAGRRAYDNVIQATAGVVAQSGGRKPGLSFVDFATGFAAGFAIAAALHQRQRDGRGQRIDCAMLDTTLMMMGTELVGELHGPDAVPVPSEAGLRPYATADGDLMLGAFTPEQNGRLWRGLKAEGFAHPEFEALADFPALWAATDAMRVGLAAIFPTRSAEAWVAWLHDNGVPGERVRTLGEAAADPELGARGLMQRPEPGPGEDEAPLLPVAPFRFAHHGPALGRRAPGFGEHTEEVLLEFGFTAGEIEALRHGGVIR